MVTNTTLFYNSNIHSKRASYKYLARGTSGGNSETKLAMSNNQGYRPFGRVFSVEICNNGKAFPSIRVEDLNYFRDIATEILIGLFVLVYTNTYFFIVVSPISVRHWISGRKLWTLPAHHWWWGQSPPKLVWCWFVLIRYTILCVIQW